MLLRGGRLQVQVQTPGVPAVVLDPYEATFNDGSWHSLTVTLARNKAVIVLDGHPMFTRRRMQFTSGYEYLFGGEPSTAACTELPVSYGLPTECTFAEVCSSNIRILSVSGWGRYCQAARD